MTDLARLLMILGAVLLVTGGVVFVMGRIPGWGRLPGDIVMRRENFTFYAPLGTCLLISGIMSLMLFFINRNNP